MDIIIESIRIYDDSHLFSIANCLKNRNNPLRIINEKIVEELLTNLYEIAGKCIRLNHDINELSSDDRSILLHTAAENVTVLGGNFILYHSKLVYDDTLWSYFESVYGKLAMDCNRWSAKFTIQDLTLFKLSLALFAFSTNSKTLHENISMEYSDIHQILEIENKYAELTWKYLIYKYNYDQAIRMFMNVIQWLLSITIFMPYAHNAQAHVNNIQSLIEQTELKLILDDIDKSC